MGGPGPASPLIFSAYQCTCICSAQLEASLGEYPSILIALGIFTLVAGFGSQATKKMAAFFARQSKWYSLLFKVILELFCCQEKGKRSRSNNEPPRKGNNRGKATLSGPRPKTMENRSVAAKIGSPLESDLSLYFLQIRKGPTDLFEGFPGNT